MHLFLVLSLCVFALAQEAQMMGSSQGSTQEISKGLEQCQDCKQSRQQLFSDENLKKIAGQEPFTLLVPNDQALMQEKGLQSADQMKKEQWFRQHVLKGLVRELKDGQTVNTIDGKALKVTKAGDKFKIGDATIVGDFKPIGKNGYFVIDKVIPFEAKASGMSSGASATQQEGGSQSQGSTQELSKGLEQCADCKQSRQQLFSDENLKKIAGQEPFTILVPNDQALMQEKGLQSADQMKKEQWFRQHVLKGLVREFKDGQTVNTIDGKTLKVTKAGDKFKIGDATVVGEFKPLGKNGYFVIDKVIPLEEKAQQQGMSSGASATQAPGFQPAQPAQPMARPEQGGEKQSVFDLVSRDPQLSMISGFIQQNPDLARQYQNVPLTFFLPRDQALQSELSRISQLPKEQVLDVILSHVVFGFIPKLFDGVKLSTLSGKDLNVRKVGENFMIDGATVIGPFHEGANFQGYFTIDKILGAPAQPTQPVQPSRPVQPLPVQPLPVQPLPVQPTRPLPVQPVQPVQPRSQ